MWVKYLGLPPITKYGSLHYIYLIKYILPIYWVYKLHTRNQWWYFVKKDIHRD